ncbi:hypothetical protein DSECCO2_520050 [anaerobic digester metagenome]
MHEILDRLFWRIGIHPDDKADLLKPRPHVVGNPKEPSQVDIALDVDRNRVKVDSLLRRAVSDRYGDAGHEPREHQLHRACPPVGPAEGGRLVGRDDEVSYDHRRVRTAVPVQEAGDGLLPHGRILSHRLRKGGKLFRVHITGSGGLSRDARSRSISAGSVVGMSQA